MQIAELRIHPVKALAPELPEAAEMDPWGLRGDRRWLIINPDGTAITQRDHHGLALIRAASRPGGLQLANAAGDSLHVPEPAEDAPVLAVRVWDDTLPARLASLAAHDWLAAQTGLPCRLVHMHDTAARPVSPAYGQPGETVSFADGFPVLLANAASLDDLNARLAMAVTMARFRPNIVITGAPAWQEDSWRLLRIGTVLLRVVKPCDRCLVTTIDPLTGTRPNPVEPIRTLGSFRRDLRGGVMFGQNAIAMTTGTLRLGDAVEVLEAGPSNVMHASARGVPG